LHSEQNLIKLIVDSVPAKPAPCLGGFFTVGSIVREFYHSQGWVEAPLIKLTTRHTVAFETVIEKEIRERVVEMRSQTHKSVGLIGVG